jgi:hypothetical protein
MSFMNVIIYKWHVLILEMSFEINLPFHCQHFIVNISLSTFYGQFDWHHKLSKRHVITFNEVYYHMAVDMIFTLRKNGSRKSLWPGADVFPNSNSTATKSSQFDFSLLTCGSRNDFYVSADLLPRGRGPIFMCQQVYCQY